MTAAVASPPISAPDMGVPAAKAAAAPQPDGSFGAMLSGLDAVADPSAPDAAKTPDTQIDDVAFADAAALTAAMTNQMSWLAQIDPAKPLPPKQDAAAPPPAPLATPPAAPPPQAAPQFGDTLSPNQPQPAASPAPVPGDTPQAAPVAQSPTGNATPVAAGNVPAAELPPETAAELPPEAAAEPAPVTKLAVVAPARQKDEKPAHPAAAPSSDVQADVPALPDLSSPPTTQVLGAPPAPAPQSAPAPAPATNPSPDSHAVLSATLAAATQTAPRASSTDKTGNDKSTAAPDAKTDSNARANATRQSRTSASAEPAPAAPSASDRPAEPPAEHAPKSEAAPLATNLPQANPAPTSSPAPVPAPIHATPDLSASAIANAPAAPSLDVSTPVRLSFAAPTLADAPSFDALALRIASRSADGENNFAIRLDPPELGRIEVNLNVNSDGQAQASLSADKPQTLDLLQKDSSALERALKDAGINLAGGMTFSLKGDSKQAWRDMQNAPRGRNIQIAAVDAANANAAITTGAALAARAYGLPVALLDIRV